MTAKNRWVFGKGESLLLLRAPEDYPDGPVELRERGRLDGVVFPWHGPVFCSWLSIHDVTRAFFHERRDLRDRFCSCICSRPVDRLMVTTIEAIVLTPAASYSYKDTWYDPDRSIPGGIQLFYSTSVEYVVYGSNPENPCVSIYPA